MSGFYKIILFNLPNMFLYNYVLHTPYKAMPIFKKCIPERKNRKANDMDVLFCERKEYSDTFSSFPFSWWYFNVPFACTDTGVSKSKFITSVPS